MLQLYRNKETKLCGLVISTPALRSGGSEFDFRAGGPLTCLKFFIVSLSLQEIVGQCLE